jgi:hypothetical protein
VQAPDNGPAPRPAAAKRDPNRDAPTPLPLDAVVVDLAAQLELNPTGLARRSNAVVFPARDADGQHLVVRAGPSARRARDAAGALAGAWLRAPRLAALTSARLAGTVVPVELWEHVGGVPGDPVSVGRGAALLATTVPPDRVASFDPFERARPEQLHLDGRIVAAADVAALFADARSRWQWWCARQRHRGWTHGDWNDTNMTVCADGSVFVFDLGDAGAGPVGFDVAAMFAQRRFERTDLGAVDTMVSAFATTAAATGSAVAAVDLGVLERCLEPVAAYVIAARVATSDDPLWVKVASQRLAALAAQRRGRRMPLWSSLADALADANGEPRPQLA